MCPPSPRQGSSAGSGGLGSDAEGLHSCPGCIQCSGKLAYQSLVFSDLVAPHFFLESRLYLEQGCQSGRLCFPLVKTTFFQRNDLLPGEGTHSCIFLQCFSGGWRGGLSWVSGAFHLGFCSHCLGRGMGDWCGASDWPQFHRVLSYHLAQGTN